jgi:hypothetical protein
MYGWIELSTSDRRNERRDARSHCHEDDVRRRIHIRPDIGNAFCVERLDRHHIKNTKVGPRRVVASHIQVCHPNESHEASVAPKIHAPFDKIERAFQYWAIGTQNL